MQCQTFLYARKSSEEDDRQALSLDAQEKECRAYAERQAIELGEVIREAHSARKPGRPKFQELLLRIDRLHAGGAPVRVLCHKPDRLLRNLGDWARINDLMERGVEFVFVTGSYPNNAQGKMAFGINVLFAKYYVDNLSEEVKKGFREKIARGEWPHAAPLGYRNAGGRIEVDPQTAPLVRRAFEYCATGEYSLAQLADRLHGEGLVGRRSGRKLAKNILATHLLSNPFYCGLLRTRSGLYPASHPPLITTALFEQVQARLKGNSRPRAYRRSFRFAGLIACGVCGGAVVGDVKKGRYTYYRCSHRRGPCSEGYLREEAVGEALRSALAAALHLPPPLEAALRDAAAKCAAEEQQLRSAERPELERRLRVLDERLGALLDLRLGGAVSDAEYAAKRTELVGAQAKIRERLAAFELAPDGIPERVDWFIATCQRLPETLLARPPAEIREALRIVGSNYRLRDKKIDFEPVTPFDMAVQMRNRPVWRASRDEVDTLVFEIARYAMPGTGQAA